MEEDLVIIFLTLVGGIEISKDDESTILNSGEIGYYFTKSNENILIHNPYENELVNYLEIRTRMCCKCFESNFFRNFNLDFNKNNFIEISNPDFDLKFFIGKHEGRREGRSLKKSKKPFYFRYKRCF